MEYLGFQITSDGICPTTEKVRAIKEAPAPSNIAELRTFAGLVNYYSRFQPNLAHHMAPLYELMRKDSQWVWRKRQQEAFATIKAMMSDDIILAHYKQTEELVVTTDASPVGLGAVLQQRNEQGDLRPIVFVSRSLTKAERNYPQIEREGLAIVFAAQKFRQYLLGRRFTLLTDHQPLVTLFNENHSVPQMASARIKRWALILSAYSYDIQYISSKKNLCADYLSRAPVTMQAEDFKQQRETEVLSVEIENMQQLPLSAKLVATETMKDPCLTKVVQLTRDGWPNSCTSDELTPYFVRRHEITMEQGCLIWGHRVVIPATLRPMLLLDLHSEHNGTVRMKGCARQYFWWPKLDNEIEKLTKQCRSCQEHAPMPPKPPTAMWNWPSGPWKRLHLDYAGPFMGSMFLIVIDAYSKWLEVYPMKQSTTSATISNLRRLFATFGTPEHIVSDNGTQFTSMEFQEFLQRNGIRYTYTAPGHPATNGLAERYVGYFKAQMKKMENDNGSLNDKICRFLLSYRTTPHPATGETPSKLLMKRDLRTRFSVLRPSLHLKDIEVFERNMGCSPKFTFGDSVYALNHRTGAKWLPGVIVDVMERSYSVQVGDCLWKRHEGQLRPRLNVPKEQMDMAPLDLTQTSILPTTSKLEVATSEGKPTVLGETVPAEPVLAESVPAPTVPPILVSAEPRVLQEAQQPHVPTPERRINPARERKIPSRYKE